MSVIITWCVKITLFFKNLLKIIKLLKNKVTITLKIVINLLTGVIKK